MHFATVQEGHRMVRDGRLQKSRIYPPLSDPIEHKFVRILICYKLSLGWRICYQLPRMEKKGYEAAWYFLVSWRIQSRTFSFGLCDVHQKFLIENDIIRGKCSDSHEVNGLVHLK